MDDCRGSSPRTLSAAGRAVSLLGPGSGPPGDVMPVMSPDAAAAKDKNEGVDCSEV